MEALDFDKLEFCAPPIVINKKEYHVLPVSLQDQKKIDDLDIEVINGDLHSKAKGFTISTDIPMEVLENLTIPQLNAIQRHVTKAYYDEKNLKKKSK